MKTKPPTCVVYRKILPLRGLFSSVIIDTFIQPMVGQVVS
mgnify:FL=1